MDKGKIMISVYGTSNKPHIWKRVYESISVTNQKFEFIFSGPRKPEDWDLPSNFKFLKTNVKPSQGQQAALWECQGEYVLCIADDAVGESYMDGKGFLDILMYFLQDTIDKRGHDKVVIAPKFKDGNRTFSQPFIRSGDCRGPNVSLNAGLVKRSFIDSIGGWDNRFIGPYAQIDVAMEMWARGGVMLKVKHAVLREQNFDRIRICGYLKTYERQLLTYLWHRPAMPNEEVPSEDTWGYHIKPIYVISKKRLHSWQHFEKTGVLEKSQGHNIKDFNWD